MNKEKMIDKILCYMHDEILKNGLKPSQARFDFIFCDEQSLVGEKTKSIKESEDLINIKNLTKLENEQIKSLIKEKNKKFKFKKLDLSLDINAKEVYMSKYHSK